MSLGQSQRAGCNMDVLFRHDGAEIDKWMFRSGGNSKEESWKEQSGYNHWLKRLKGEGRRKKQGATVTYPNQDRLTHTSKTNQLKATFMLRSGTSLTAC